MVTTQTRPSVTRAGTALGSTQKLRQATSATRPDGTYTCEQVRSGLDRITVHWKTLSHNNSWTNKRTVLPRFPGQRWHIFPAWDQVGIYEVHGLAQVSVTQRATIVKRRNALNNQRAPLCQLANRFGLWYFPAEMSQQRCDRLTWMM